MSGYDRKRLDRAFTISIIALVGFFIPILGIILALIAIGIGTGVENHNDRMEQRWTAVIVISSVAILMSLVAAYGWYRLYQYSFSEQQNNLLQEVNTVNQQRQSSQAALDTCLSQADFWYEEYVRLNALDSQDTPTGRAYRAEQHIWDNARTGRKELKDECYRRYSQL